MDETADTKRQIEKLPQNVRDQDVSVDTNFKQDMRAYHRRLRNMNTSDNQSLSDIEWIQKRLEHIESIIKTLEQAIDDYLTWMTLKGYCSTSYQSHKNELKQFLEFIAGRRIDWDEIFTFDTLELFKKEKQLAHSHGVRRMSRYLFEQKRIPRPIQAPVQQLPEVYEQ